MIGQMNVSKDLRWVWLDLEMTGLNEANCVILQIAMVITNIDLEEIVSKEITIWQPDSELNKMDPYVFNIHVKNSLIDLVRISNISLMQAELQLMEILTKYVGYKKGILAGNTIYVDRRFLKRYIPVIESYLNYRQIDVSSLKMICKSWCKSGHKFYKKKSIHTAMSDIRQSIFELESYRSFFK